MGFGEAISSGFRNYANFSGRTPRSGYWFWTLFVVLVSLVAKIVDFGLTGDPRGGLVAGIVSLILIIPGIAISVRRLHDRDKSGWFFLLCLIPIVGWIILLVWYCQRGTTGTNRFGPDPLPA
jgi:uncharacterized membrane protein YhaH (DUF805 family)